MENASLPVGQVRREPHSRQAVIKSAHSYDCMTAVRVTTLAGGYEQPPDLTFLPFFLTVPLLVEELGDASMNANQLDDHSFEAQWMELHPLETFDPIAFRGDETVPQSVCDLVLALALAFNDLKDIFYAHIILEEYKQDGTPPPRTRAFGLYNGVNVHLLRLLMGTVYELLNLIGRKEAIVQDAAFLKTVRLLPKDSRDAWNEVVSIALNRECTATIGKALLDARNHVAFHYDLKRIQSGYRRHFLSSQNEDTRAYISRGENMKETRFYFADAAAYGYLRNEEGTSPGDLANNLVNTVGRVSLSLRDIVTRFIQYRKCAFRAEAES